MRRATVVLAASGALALVLAACSAIFGDSAQCSGDGDCIKFGDTVCGPEGTCVPASSVDRDGSAGGDGSVTPGDDGGGGGDAPSIVCIPDAARAIQPIPGTAFDAGTNNAAGVSIDSDTRLSCDKDWALTGTVVVRSGATLTIDRGTFLRADTNAALVVQPGGRIVAEGTANEPIVITSSKATKAPGDFRGVFVLGRATNGYAFNGDPLLTFGGAAPDESSGSLEYVRVEYAQTALVLAGVGRGTSVDYVQARRTSSDAISFVGGTVNAKHLAVQLPGDEAFEIQSGYTGKLQFLIAQRIVNGITHNALLVEASRPTIYNATFCGTNGGSAMGVTARNNGRPDLHNGVVMGYAAGFDVVGDAGANLQVAACHFFGQVVDPYAYPEDAGETDDASPYFDDDNGFDEIAFLSDPARNNSKNDPQITGCFNANNPSFAPAATLTGGAPPNDGFFDSAAAYRGAVKDNTDGWATAPWLVWSAN